MRFLWGKSHGRALPIIWIILSFPVFSHLQQLIYSLKVKVIWFYLRNCGILFMNKNEAFRAIPLQIQRTTLYFCFSLGHSLTEICFKIDALCRLRVFCPKFTLKILFLTVFPYYWERLLKLKTFLYQFRPHKFSP